MTQQGLFEEAVAEAERHKFLESQKAGRDLGHGAIDDWQRRHWTVWLRHRWIEHLLGLRCWEEFEPWRCGRLRTLFPDQEPLLAELAEKVRGGAENADMLWWAAKTHRDIRLVVAILIEMDINDIRCCRGCFAFADGMCHTAAPQRARAAAQS